jgi:hypothetical protein
VAGAVDEVHQLPVQVRAELVPVLDEEVFR